MMNNGLNAYQQAKTHAQAAAASPHRLILMLLDGLLDNLTRARGFMERGQIEQKGQMITKCLDIFQGLSAILDMEKGGDVAIELHRLYDYCGRSLFEANIQNNTAMVDEVSSLISEIREGWMALHPSKVTSQ
ncbi:MAG: flagellar export chaperone FliS [Plesiomonas sp.]|uniref:flagellar export chaperone FliS n=1 Tax=Plesiomonas sp. TaxID=2486279 RepID=UPI003F410D53